MAPNTPQLQLSILVATPVDVGRLLREIEKFDNEALQHELRSKEQPSELSKPSLMLDRVIQDNKLDLTQKADRQQLQQFMQQVKNKSPILHMSFSANPPQAFIEKLVSYLRREIHPLVLVTVGLQPNIGAGCIVRSTNKQFDLSLRQDFLSKKPLLLEAINTVMAKAAGASA